MACGPAVAGDGEVVAAAAGRVGQHLVGFSRRHEALRVAAALLAGRRLARVGVPPDRKARLKTDKMDPQVKPDPDNFDNLPPPPPPSIPPNVNPMKATKPKRSPMARPGIGRKGNAVQLLTNHFKVSLRNVDDYFYHYSVALKYEDDRPVDGKGVGRKVIDKLHQTYDTELGKKDFAYDGEKSLFTLGALPQVNNEFTVVLEDLSSNRIPGNGNAGNNSPGESDHKRARRPKHTKTFKVLLSFAAKIPMKSIAAALKGNDTENSQEALRVLDIILRQHAAKQGCLLVRQSFFQNNPKSFTDIGGGVIGCRGFHSSFRTSQGGLSLNIDVSTTMIVKPGAVVDFLLANQNVKNPNQLDWNKARRTLKNLRVKTTHTNQEFKIIGISDKPCKDEIIFLFLGLCLELILLSENHYCLYNADASATRFTLKLRNGNDGNGNSDAVEVTVYDYFVRHRRMQLSYSADFPCLNVGKPKRPTYVPLELCSLVSLQRYTKSLSTFQRASLVEKSRQKPRERMSVLGEALRSNNYDADPLLRACGVSIATTFTQIEGRVLQPPRLRVGNGEDFMPSRGRWNFNQKKLMEPARITRWAVVNFSARCDVSSLIRDMLKCANMKGISMEEPFQHIFEENPSMRRAPPVARAEEMFRQVKQNLPGDPKFLLCILSERKNSDIYDGWYKLLSLERSSAIPLVSDTPTIILGMDVSHGSPGHSDIPSIAAVVSSRQWPSISRYRASVRTQSPKVEMIDSLFKPVIGNTGEKYDNGIIRELMVDFYNSSGKRKPENIIIFRDGVSESQFTQVLNIEFDQIIEACKFLDEHWSPKFTLIIAQKNHHTKFFLPNSPDNVQPGTVIDNKICHPKNYDFYMCAHAGMIGTTRPTHYHVLMDEIGFTVDSLQELVHSLSYVYQRSTTAISVVAPICYAHLAAAQIGQFVKFEDLSDSSSSQGGRQHTAPGAIPVPELPRLDKNVSSSMFFC
ncbi:hypothetical protein ZIOFF_009025 [Zingiber officinale]|uniref:Uncharacterized protein n=1 Tax=Zingiber officinale TaxID=94328 RepID=A0A8J5LR65_ZINOF|nr:hypothetical protein ZIOFF_009025 [Zingiber officinale]